MVFIMLMIDSLPLKCDIISDMPFKVDHNLKFLIVFQTSMQILMIEEMKMNGSGKYDEIESCN